jgi:hydroxyacylglutathione hydrolase
MKVTIKMASSSAATRHSIRKDSLRIESLVVPPLANNVYILYEDGSDSGIVIDVAMGAETITTRLRELEIRADLIINTHGHSDHTVQDDLLRRSTGAKLAIHELDAYRLAAEDEAAEQLGLEMMPIVPDVQLVDGQEVRIGPRISMKVIHTPGHTEGSICLYDEKRGQLFSGDTLFAKGYGRTDGMGADQGAMVSSLKKLFALPGPTEVYPGHGEFTTIQDETWILDAMDEQ